MLFPIAAATILLTACARENSNPVVMPALEQYALDVQTRAAYELDALPPPCPRTEAPPGCSALATMIPDYLTLRNRIRAAQ